MLGDRHWDSWRELEVEVEAVVLLLGNGNRRAGR